MLLRGYRLWNSKVKEGVMLGSGVKWEKKK
jgi:hypothetical protein